MKIIELKAADNGGHRNLSIDGIIEIFEGWARIPDGMKLENFPFGEATAEEIGGVMTVTNWKPGVMPAPAPKPEPEPSAEEITDILLGVNE